MSDAATSQAASPEDQIRDVLATIRPAVRADGGDIELVGYDREEGRVRVRMMGACHACPMSMMTLKAGLEQRLRMKVPEVRSVEAV